MGLKVVLLVLPLPKNGKPPLRKQRGFPQPSLSRKAKRGSDRLP